MSEHQDFQCVDCRTLNFSHGYCKGCGVPPEVDGRSTRRYMGMHKQLEAATAEIVQLRIRLAEVEKARDEACDIAFSKAKYTPTTEWLDRVGELRQAGRAK